MNRKAQSSAPDVVSDPARNKSPITRNIFSSVTYEDIITVNVLRKAGSSGK